MVTPNDGSKTGATSKKTSSGGAGTTNAGAGLSNGKENFPTTGGSKYTAKSPFRAGEEFGFPSKVYSSPEQFALTAPLPEVVTILQKFGMPLRNAESDRNSLIGFVRDAAKANFVTLGAYANQTKLWNSGGISGNGSATNPSKSQLNPYTGTLSPLDQQLLNILGANTSKQITPTVANNSGLQEQSAQASVDNTLQSWGLDTPEMQNLSWKLISDPGNHLDAGLVINLIRQTKTYKDRFPGINNIIVGDGKQMTESAYISHETDVKNQLSQFQVPKGFIGEAEIGKLIQNGVYGGNLTDRLQKGYALVQNAPQETKDILKNWYGVDTGHLLMHYLDPSGGMTQKLLTQTQAALIGTASADAGFGGPSGLSRQTSEALAQQALTDPNNMNMANYKAGFAKAAQYQPLEQEQVGQRGQATISQAQILGQVFPGMHQATGTTAAGDAAALRMAQEARVAGLSGGGGYDTSAKGAIGIGRAGSTGVGSA
jgi:hypothetical protein